MADEMDEIEITSNDRNINAIEALSKLIPGGIGEAAFQLFYKQGEAARFRRFEKTLKEVAEKLEKQGKASEFLENEDFAKLMQESSIPISESTNEDKRKMFRDLLTNSAILPMGDPGWQESMFCLDLLRKLDPVALYVLATVAKANKKLGKAGWGRFNGDWQWVFVSNQDVSKGSITMDGNTVYESPGYSTVLINDQLGPLSDHLGLIARSSIAAQRTNIPFNVDLISLTERGSLLIKWTMEDF